jgi:uncharacterized protein YuzE
LLLAYLWLERINMPSFRQNLISVQSRTPPTVVIDTEAGAAYVRFKRPETRVARTQQLPKIGVVVTVDYDRDDEVIGIELLGVKEFGIVKLLGTAQVKAPNADLSRARYVGAGHFEREPLAAVG